MMFEFVVYAMVAQVVWFFYIREASLPAGLPSPGLATLG